MTDKATLIRNNLEFVDGTGIAIDIADIRYIAPHIHDCILEFVYCIRGSVHVSLGYESHALHEGEFLSIDHDVHMLCSDEPNVTVTFHLNMEERDNNGISVEHMFFVCPHETPSIRLDRRLREIRHIFIGMLLLFFADEKSERRTAFIKARKQILEIMIKDFTIAGYCNEKAASSDGISAQVATIINYLVERYSERISLHDLAQVLHMNKNYVSQFFKRYLPGYTEWLGFIRTTMSTRLLLNNDKLCIEDISEAVGFSEKKYYYGVFRKWYGCTPSEYRRAYIHHMKRQDEINKIHFGEISSLIEKLANSAFFERLGWN
jgi:AraC-like DNA-binding protein